MLPNVSSKQTPPHTFPTDKGITLPSQLSKKSSGMRLGKSIIELILKLTNGLFPKFGDWNIIP